ncbi:PREDICTED: uncharacterized protein LOC108552457 [Eufriesea mexicana]|nr:PREDICTED: uncharacterized protein LOC108552457 [Eufriesea mexicana]
MFKFLITFGIGIYVGICLSQNYNIPRLDDPDTIMEKIKELKDQYRKK